MGPEVNKVSSEVLETISGGVEGDYTSISQCPPGTIDMKGEIPENLGTQKSCPHCGSKYISDTALFVSAWANVVDGQVCEDCGAIWR